MLINIPEANKSIMVDDEPIEINGSGTPVNGTIDNMAAIFKSAWKVIQVVIPTARSLEYLSGAFSATLYPLYAITKKANTKSPARKKPSSSAVTAKMESVAASGK